MPWCEYACTSVVLPIAYACSITAMYGPAIVALTWCEVCNKVKPHCTNQSICKLCKQHTTNTLISNICCNQNFALIYNIIRFQKPNDVCLNLVLFFPASLNFTSNSYFSMWAAYLANNRANPSRSHCLSNLCLPCRWCVVVVL